METTKLEKITIGGVEYYQWVINGEVGDIFSDWREIQRYKSKLKEQQS